MSEINYLSEVRPNPGNDGEKPQTCSICGALLVCLSCGNHRDEAMDQARARIAELDERQEDYQGRLWCALGQPSGIEFIEAVKQMRARIAELERPIDMDEIQLALGNYSIYARPEYGMRNALAWFIRNRAKEAK